MHLSPSISAGKAPMDTRLLRIALSRQGHNVLPQMIEALHAFGQTAAFKNADLNLGHIEPTPMLGRVMHLQSLPDTLRFLGRKGLVEAGRRLRVEVVHDQADHARLWIDLIHQPADRLREIQPGALLGQLHRTATGQRFHKHEQVRRPQAFIFRVGALGMARLHRQWLAHLPMDHQRLFVKTDPWSLGIIRLGVQIQHVLHGRHKVRIHGGNAPLLMLPGLQRVFFSNWRTVSGEIRRTYPNSTAWPASIRTVQWSCPSGTVLHVIAMRWAACPSLSAWCRRACRLSVSTASTPPAPYRCRTLRMVWSDTSKASTISPLLQPSSHLSRARARVNVRALALPRRTNTSTWVRSSSLRWSGVTRFIATSPVFPSAYHKNQTGLTTRSLSQLFGQGFLVNLLNPKTALFFYAFLPQFVDPARGAVAGQILLLGALFVLLASCTDSLYALLGSTVGRVL